MGLGTKLLNPQSHNFANFFIQLNYIDIILGRKPFEDQTNYQEQPEQNSEDDGDK